MIPESHPLQQLFVELIGRHYAEEIGIRDPQIVNYVAHLMAEFCEVEQLFKIRNGSGKPLTDVGEMLIESNPIYGPAPSFDRERQVRKHRQRFAQRLVLQHLLRCIRNMVGAANNVGEPHIDVICHHAQVVRRHSIRTQQNKVFEICIRELNAAKDRVIERRHAAIGHGKPQRGWLSCLLACIGYGWIDRPAAAVIHWGLTRCHCRSSPLF